MFLVMLEVMIQPFTVADVLAFGETACVATTVYSCESYAALTVIARQTDWDMLRFIQVLADDTIVVLISPNCGIGVNVDFRFKNEWREWSGVDESG